MTEVIYPLGLRLDGRKVVIVGGGAVGTRRVKGLLQAGAKVTVISPEVSAELKDLSLSGQLEWLERGFEPGDLKDAWLVHTATGSAAVDQQVTDEAEALRILCVNAAEAEKSTAWVPATVRKAGATVASFGGGDPRRAMALRDAIGALFEASELPLEHHRQSSSPNSITSQEPGTVALVGGGPSHPGLITALGVELLKAADVVVTDRLGPTDLLDTLPSSTLVINVGKMPDHHPVPQDEINRILVQHAKAGKRVVRLKGGDPYVLGRGGEELAFCEEQGVRVLVVPGVTSAISVPAAAGIPVTHRGLATGFSVLTGHQELDAIPGSSDHTVVILMGVNTLAANAEALAKTRGLDCPIAVIEDGWLPTQRVTVGTLETIAALAEELGVKAPAVIVAGDVVLLSPFARDLAAGRINLEK